MPGGPVLIKKKISPCSIWQGLWAAAQERRYRTVVYREEGTKVPSLNTGVVASTRWTKQGVGKKSFINGASLAAVQHLLSPILIALLYDYGLWMDNRKTMQSFQAFLVPTWTVDRGLRGHRKGPKPAISLVYLYRMYSVLVSASSLSSSSLSFFPSFLLSFFPSFLLYFFTSLLLCFFASLLLCFFASLHLCFFAFFPSFLLVLCSSLSFFFHSILLSFSKPLACQAFGFISCLLPFFWI
jgi:hypothetical protein